jgi:hypothetical protein
VVTKESTPYEVRDKEGNVLRSGRVVNSNQAEIMINRGKGERLWYFMDSDLQAGWVEQGAYAERPVAVATERPEIPTSSVNQPMSENPDCACGRVSAEACLCDGVSIKEDIIAMSDNPQPLAGRLGARLADSTSASGTREHIGLFNRLSPFTEAEQNLRDVADKIMDRPWETPAARQLRLVKDEIQAPEHYGGEPPLFRKGVQPIELIRSMNLGFFEGNVIKYVARHRAKDGLRDLKKAQTYLTWLIREVEAEEAGL